MKLERILCPIDFSEFNQSANEHASVLAKSTGAQMDYLHVWLPESYRTASNLPRDEQTEMARLEKLRTYEPTLPGIEVRHVVQSGLIADRIIHYAKENEVDLIVMATHGRTGLRRVLMGSIAEAVIRDAECPVLAIKSKWASHTPHLSVVAGEVQ